MSIPEEFTPAAIEASSVNAFRPYREFLKSGEPYVSIFLNNMWLNPPKADAALE